MTALILSWCVLLTLAVAVVAVQLCRMTTKANRTENGD